MCVNYANFYRVVITSLLVWPIQILAQTTEPVMEVPLLDELVLDMDMEFTETSAASWRDRLRFTFSYQAGLDLNKLTRVTSHRFDSRLRGEYLWQDSLFFKWDGKAILRLPGDDQMDASNNASEDVGMDGRLRELFVQKSAKSWTSTWGFQTITWGEMDAVQIADQLSPWDYSEFAFTTPEDARLGQLLINSEWYSPFGQWQFIINPWPQTNRYPGGGASYLLEQSLGTSSFQVNQQQPDFFDDYELALRWTLNQQGYDISLMATSLLNNDPVFEMIMVNPQGTSIFNAKFPRFEMIAATANYSAGNLLWKAETAFKQDIHVAGSQSVIRDVLDAALGFDYDANGAWDVTVELLNQHILSGPGDLAGLRKNNTQWVARWRKQWLHQTLSSVYYVSYQLQHRDTVHSMALNYAITDAWLLDVNATLFESTEAQSPGQLTKNWDQLTFRLSFTY